MFSGKKNMEKPLSQGTLHQGHSHLPPCQLLAAMAVIAGAQRQPQGLPWDPGATFWQIDPQSCNLHGGNLDILDNSMKMTNIHQWRVPTFDQQNRTLFGAGETPKKIGMILGEFTNNIYLALYSLYKPTETLLFGAHGG